MKVLDGQQLLDFMETIEDRHGQKATIIISQLPIVNWYDVMKGNTIAADAILDRLVHTSVCFEPQCESMRQKRHSGNSVKEENLYDYIVIKIKTRKSERKSTVFGSFISCILFQMFFVFWHILVWEFLPFWRHNLIFDGILRGQNCQWIHNTLCMN